MCKKYYKIDDTNELKLNLDYSLGGTNYATMKPERRGYYLYISTVQRDAMWETTTIFSDISGNNIKTGKILVLEVKRKSQKKYAYLCDTIDFDFIAKEWLSMHYNNVFNYLEEAA